MPFLVLTFGSFRMAGIILAVGTLSIGLGLLSLWLFSYPIGIVAIIGIAGLMGLAINDSIVILSECQLGRQHAQPIEESVYHATSHVLTTSVTTVAGVLPLILSGGDFFPPMMIVIAGGVTGATFLALGFTPACFRFGRIHGSRRMRLVIGMLEAQGDACMLRLSTRRRDSRDCVTCHCSRQDAIRTSVAWNARLIVAKLGIFPEELFREEGRPLRR